MTGVSRRGIRATGPLLACAVIALCAGRAEGQLEPDLVITAVVPTDYTPTVGVPITVNVTVENVGAGNAGTFNVVLFYNESVAPSVGDTPDVSQDVIGGLAAGGTRPVTFINVTSPIAETWQMYAIVDNGAAVAESNELNNVYGPVTVVWGTAGAPDLAITAVTPSDAAPAIDDSISVDVTVRNQGIGAAGSFTVALYYSLASQPTVADTPDQTQVVSSLAAAAETIVTFTGISNAAVETWSMYTWADSLDTVAEVNEADNIAGPIAVDWRHTDLVITAITPSDPSPMVDDNISVEVTVLNQGTSDAGAFVVELFHNPGAAPLVGDPGDQTQPVASLAAGTSTTVTFTGVTSATSGPWETYAVADNGEAVSETDETNNVAGPEGIVWLEAGTDLVITSIAPSASTALTGDPITVDVTVLNQGAVDAGAFSVGLYYDPGFEPSAGGSADQVEAVVSLTAGASTTVSFTGVTSLSSGTWGMYAVADQDDAVAEADETNNVAGPESVLWLSAGVDLIIAAITPSASSAVVGDTVTVDVTVLNQGATDAGAFSVELFLNPGTAPTAGQPGDMSEPVASLAGGTQTTVTFVGIAGASVETWAVYAVADGGEAVAEDDETNNVGGPVALDWTAPPSEQPYLGDGCGVRDQGGTSPWLLAFFAFVASMALRRRSASRRQSGSRTGRDLLA